MFKIMFYGKVSTYPTKEERDAEYKRLASASTFNWRNIYWMDGDSNTWKG